MNVNVSCAQILVPFVTKDIRPKIITLLWAISRSD